MAWTEKFRKEMADKILTAKRQGFDAPYASGEVERECARQQVEFHEPRADGNGAEGPTLVENLYRPEEKAAKPTAKKKAAKKKAGTKRLVAKPPVKSSKKR